MSEGVHRNKETRLFDKDLPVFSSLNGGDSKERSPEMPASALGQIVCLFPGR